MHAQSEGTRSLVLAGVLFVLSLQGISVLVLLEHLPGLQRNPAGVAILGVGCLLGFGALAAPPLASSGGSEFDRDDGDEQAGEEMEDFDLGEALEALIAEEAGDRTVLFESRCCVQITCSFRVV